MGGLYPIAGFPCKALTEALPLRHNGRHGLDALPLTFVALPIVLAVLKVAAVAAGGFWMARRGVLHPAALADLSRLVIQVAVPCLIFANAAGGFAGLSAGAATLAVAGGPVVLGIGALSGFALCRLLRVDAHHVRAVVCAATFQNQAYLPIAVTMAVLPPLAGLLPPGPDTTATSAAGTGVVLISLYGVLYSPLFWGVGLSWLTETAGERVSWRARLLPPPVWGVLAGFAVGLTPPLRHFLTVPDAPLFFLFAAVRDIGGLAVPLANLILGAMLAGVGSERVMQGRDALTVIVSRLLLTPGVVLLALWLGRGWWTGSGTGCVAAFVVFLQAAMPSATNLAVMSKSRAGSDAERVMPGLLLACYGAAIVTVPLWLTLFFRLLTARQP